MYWQNANYEWATKYVYGIEKDYRLVKVGKVGCYLHGDGLANVILSDGLGNFVSTKDYQGKLRKYADDNSKDNQQFDIILSNPPYSVSSFKQTTRDYYTEKDFELYESLTDNSSEIECLFVERTKQLLKDGGVAGIILPCSILTNTGIYTKTRELLLKYFEFIAITELGSNTFMATGTNTVVLFLRRRNNYACVNLEKDVERFFTAHTDVTINNIESPVEKYIKYVWENLTFDDYITLLDENPNDTVQQHDLYKEYLQKLKVKTNKEFWKKVRELEKEKICYFILAYSQKLVIVKTGEKDAEKQFLGYEFSNRRGSEGIHAIQRNKTIDECTKLFDINSFENSEKASTYIYQAFNGNLSSEISESMQDNVARVDLLDMMTFDRADFEKIINTKVKKKIKIESKYPFEKIENIVAYYGTGITYDKSDVVFTESKNVILTADNITLDNQLEIKKKIFLNNDKELSIDKKLKRNDIFICFSSGSKAHIGKFAFIDRDLPCYAGGFMGIIRANINLLLPKYLYLILNYNPIRQNIRDISTGSNINNLSSYLKDLKIPLPPLEVQQKIVAEIEEVETEYTKYLKKVDTTRREIKKLLNDLYHNATKKIRLSDTTVFSLAIGKRVLNSDLNINGAIPVYSANVFQPFGYIDELLINDFSSASILWGIDGDWMTNVIAKNTPFYPTDHCGYIRILKDSVIIDKYLAYALNEEGKVFGFSRTKRASIDRVESISIPLPDFSEQQKIAAQIEELEKQIAEAQAVIDASKQQKQEILDKYLK